MIDSPFPWHDKHYDVATAPEPGQGYYGFGPKVPRHGRPPWSHQSGRSGGMALGARRRARLTGRHEIAVTDTGGGL